MSEMTDTSASAKMISDIGNDLVTTYGETCKAFAWFGPLSLSSMRDMVGAENALVGFIAALGSTNARLTAELSALRAEKAELDSGMHEMRTYRDGYDPKTKPPTEKGEYLCLLRIDDPEIGDRFAVIDWDGTRFLCLDCTVLRYWSLPVGKGEE